MSADTMNKDGISRRAMLSKLGLAAAAVYAAPVMLQLSEAKASGYSGGGSFSGGGRRYRGGRVRRHYRRGSFS